MGPRRGAHAARAEVRHRAAHLCRRAAGRLELAERRIRHPAGNLSGLSRQLRRVRAAGGGESRRHPDQQAGAFRPRRPAARQSLRLRLFQRPPRDAYQLGMRVGRTDRLARACSMPCSPAAPTALGRDGIEGHRRRPAHDGRAVHRQCCFTAGAVGGRVSPRSNCDASTSSAAASTCIQRRSRVGRSRPPSATWIQPGKAYYYVRVMHATRQTPTAIRKLPGAPRFSSPTSKKNQRSQATSRWRSDGLWRSRSASFSGQACPA